MGDLALPDPDSFAKNYAGICFVVDQTRWLKSIFDCCADEPWCYEKHKVTDGVEALSHNGILGTNYFIYFDRKFRPSFIDGHFNGKA